MFLVLGRHNGLSYDYHAPARDDGHTFVCFNPLTGDKAMWQQGIGPAITEAGHGLLSWNLRGQADSPFSPGEISEAGIIADATKLLGQVNPPNPVYVGLSVGGLYAAKLHLANDRTRCTAFVLINTLREMTPRLKWINTALVRLAQTGGLDLLRDVYTPLLLNEAWQEQNRTDFLKDGGYTPIAEADGALHLLKAGEATRWDVDWSTLGVPVLNITGLQDRIFRDAPVINKILATIPRAKAIEYDDAGHMIPAEQPARLAQDILEFAGALS